MSGVTCGYAVGTNARGVGLACGRPATSRSSYGNPRCDEHAERRYLVLVGSSLTLTQLEHLDDRSACAEVLQRLGYATKLSSWASPEQRARHDRQLDRAKAWPATEADLATWSELVEQHVPANRRRLIEEGKARCDA